MAGQLDSPTATVLVIFPFLLFTSYPNRNTASPAGHLSVLIRVNCSSSSVSPHSRIQDQHPHPAAAWVQSGQLCKRASSCCDVSDDYPTVTYFFTHKPSQHPIRDAKQKYENPLGKINPNRNRCGVHSFDRRRPASIRALPQLAGTRPPACLHPSAAAARQNSAAAHHFPPPRCSTRLQAAVPAIRPWSTADAAPRMEDAARHQASERRRRGP